MSYREANLREEDPPCNWCDLLDVMNQHRIHAEEITLRVWTDYIAAYADDSDMPIAVYSALPLVCLCGRRSR